MATRVDIRIQLDLDAQSLVRGEKPTDAVEEVDPVNVKGEQFLHKGGVGRVDVHVSVCGGDAAGQQIQLPREDPNREDPPPPAQKPNS